MFPALTVEGSARAGAAVVHVFGLNVGTTNKDTVIATVKNEYRPKVPVRSFFRLWRSKRRMGITSN